jgi:Putative Ig domain
MKITLPAIRLPSLALISYVLALAFSPHAEAAYRYSNLPPTISGSPSLDAIVGQTYDFTPQAQDPEGRALVFSIFGLPQWAKFDRYTGRLSGVPGTANVGTSARIIIAVSDRRGMAYLPEFRITVRSATPEPTAPTNAVPQISGTPAGTATVGVAYTFQPGGSDADGDAITFGITNKPAWATFNASTGLLTGTPTTAGTHSAISISASDGKATTTLPAFSIVVGTSATQNTAPTISGTPTTVVAAGATYAFQPVASDADGNPLGFSIANKPSWASFNTTTGRLSGTPTTAVTHAGITISVSDGTATASLPSFTLTVSAPANRAPVISGSPPASVNVAGTYAFTPVASDADGNALTFTIANKPVWATFNSANGQLGGTPTSANVGTFSGISITVSDGVASATLGPFAITVNQLSLGSATLSWVPPTQNTDGSTLTNLSGYRIYYGTSASTMTQSISITNASVSTYLVGNLSPATWYFAVKAIANGVESDFSNMASKVIN